MSHGRGFVVDRCAHCTATVLCALLLAACAQLPIAPPPAPVAPPPTAPAEPTPLAVPSAAPAPVAAPVSVIEVVSQPAAQALLGGMRAYEDGQYAQAEQRLKSALKIGLDAPRDLATAHKTLAFVYCSSRRLKLCEAAFRAARDADPAFALSKAEAGHPTWGPVYRRLGDTR